MAIARGFNNVAFVSAGVARQEVSMLAEKRLQIRRQQFTEAGCRAADVSLHKYSSTKRIHRSYAPLVCSLIGRRHRVVVEVHVTVGFGPQTDAPSDGLRQFVLQV